MTGTLSTLCKLPASGRHYANDAGRRPALCYLRL